MKNRLAKKFLLKPIPHSSFLTFHSKLAAHFMALNTFSKYFCVPRTL